MTPLLPLVVAVLGVSASLVVTARQVAQPEAAQPGAASRDLHALAERARARLDVLRKEADALASRARSLLVDLRRLDVARQLREAELAAAEADLARVTAELEAATTRIDIVNGIVAREKPDVAARLVRLYKHGAFDAPRWWLGVDDMRAAADASRLLVKLAADDRARLAHYQQALADLASTRVELEARQREAATLREQAAVARREAAEAVAAHRALVAEIDKRRDLTAQLAGELQQAQDDLERAVDEVQSAGGAPAVVLPIKPFQGALDWPVHGTVRGAFGRAVDARVGQAVERNGIEIQTALETPVRVVHEGRVAFADAFTGFGRLAVVDHGQGTFSLYGHLAALDVSTGDRVKAGAILGRSGESPNGNPAVYFELRVDGRPVDPLQWLKRP